MGPLCYNDCYGTMTPEYSLAFEKEFLTWNKPTGGL
jgi:hypothetical protein